MARMMKMLGNIGLGAGLMYFLDPDRGARRRALVRDKLYSLLYTTSDALDVAVDDLSNRTVGLVTETKAAFENEYVTDRVLAERVRAKIGRVVSPPTSIEVSAHQGHITLSGMIQEQEVGALVSAVQGVQGVSSITNQLEIHTHRENVPRGSHG